MKSIVFRLGTDCLTCSFFTQEALYGNGIAKKCGVPEPKQCPPIIEMRRRKRR